MSDRSAEVDLLPVSREAAAAVLEGSPPPGLAVPDDYPTEFSRGVAKSVGGERTIGPFFIRRRGDDLVVGELGGALIDDSTIEIGYAVAGSVSGRGYASAAVVEFAEAVRGHPTASRVVAHTPPDRPASARVLEKAGFTRVGEVEDEHEGEVIKVDEWELALG